jgi:ATP-dependent RNA helicase RhlE
MTSFKNLNLNPKILAALENKGYTTPTPIQLQAIPHVLEGKDLLGIAQTGTGKTAAFSLPILHNLTESAKPVKSHCVRTLILTPTRELASQIADNIEIYGKELGLRYAVIFGGVSERPQISNMQKGVDILIATPGRLLDLMNQGHIRFMHLEILVLDEADRMLDMGFINDVKKIIAKVPQERQTLFFSATMPETIADLAHSILKKPVKIEVTPQSTTVERIEQKINYVERGNKLPLLKRILKQEDAKSVLIFSKTKHGANKIVDYLDKSSIAVAAIHGNKSQGAREKALLNFREGKVQVLVATDIAARGIDIPAISHVINYDVPMDPESYVHRIGRTARAGRQGIAITFCDPSETKLLQAVEKTIKYKVPVDRTHPFHGVDASPESTEPRQERQPRRSNAALRTNSASSRPARAGFSPARSASSSDRRSATSRNENEGEKSGILGLMGFGKKSDKDFSKRRPAREENFNREGNSTRAPREFKNNKKGGFSFGSWFKKPSDSRSEGRKDDSFGNRERPSSGNRERSAGGGGFRERSPGAGARERSGERAPRERRESSSSFGNHRERQDNGNREGASFGKSARTAMISGEGRSRAPRERREGSSFGDRKPFGERKTSGFSSGTRRSPSSGNRSPSPKKRWQ